jgi:formate dehydrogenase maturation protein FdhE
MNVGEEANPRYAVRPDTSSLFRIRTQRLAALAPEHELGSYLKFIAAAAQVQQFTTPGRCPP